MTATDKILLVDDEKLIRMTLHDRLEQAGFRVTEAERGDEALECVRRDDPDLVLLDYRLPDLDGLEVLRRIRREGTETGVILMTAYSSVDSAVEALKLGAADYLKKPIDHEQLLAAITRTLETTRLRREVRRLRSEQRKQFGSARIIGRSPAIRALLELIHKVAGSAAATVLIQGESGTGKDLAAKAIHQASDRADKPFMNITCSALPETLLESELFGHEPGAFTDAKRLKKGLLELADGGTVFLDEIGDMGATLQAKLLRFLEEKTFRRLGGGRDLRVNVRVIAATNRPLERAVRQGDFREDLYYRLNVVPIELPPLSERPEDIPDLVGHFVAQFNREFRKNTHGVTPEALGCLTRYHWPGNVRELRNVIERAMILEQREELDVTDLPEEIVHAAPRARASGDSSPGPGAAASGTGTGTAPRTAHFALPEGGVSLSEVERDLLRQALETTDGNQTRAAGLLDISRDALRYRMKKFGML